MRKLTKLPIPPVLEANAVQWLAEFRENRTSDTCRYRYRDREIKATVKAETHSKCAYCESKIGHVTPGDVEHKRPTRHNIDLHFEWSNLTLACGECNRRKGDYDDAECPFIDPYNDDVDAMLCHHGPVVGWQPGCTIAEVSVKMLDLDSKIRTDLIFRKIEKIQDLNNRLGRFNDATNPVLKELLRKDILAMCGPDAEYASMIKAVLAHTDFPPEDAADGVA